MSTPVLPLASGFSPASREQWLALVTKTLKGAEADSLVLTSADGQPVQPFYGEGDSPNALGFAVPAKSPARGWDVRASVAGPSLDGANQEALEALAGGAASILVKLDTGDGFGIPANAEADLSRVLDGVLTDVATVALDAAFLGPLAARWLGAVAKSAPGAPLALNLDPLSAFAHRGGSPGPITAHVAAAAAEAARLSEVYPKAALFLASGTVAHEAGGSPAWEIAMAAAAAVAYAKALVDAGLGIEAAFARLTLGLTAQAEPLETIAKLRAARVVWARITQACGVNIPARIEARSSRRMLTRADRWTNLVRLTSAGFAAAVGGADAIVLGAFTDAIGRPDAFALRMARNTQLILMEEAHLGRVADPAGGAWAMEAQTTALAGAAWAAFVRIEAAGGLALALSDGTVAAAVASSREALEHAIASRDLRIIGVTDFKSAEPTPDAAPGPDGAATTAPDVRLPGEGDVCPPLTPVRLEEMAR